MQEKHLTKSDLEDLGQLLGGLLDKQAAVLATKEDLTRVEGRFDEMATKHDLKDLKEFMIEGFETVMEGVNSLVGFKPLR